MSRQARLSFIREDFYDAVRRRIMMDMTIGDCQLSKLYAYNGLMTASALTGPTGWWSSTILRAQSGMSASSP